MTYSLIIPRFLSLKVKDLSALISCDGWTRSLPGKDLISFFFFRGGRF